ncbi:RICIN domain-containing protein [Bacillus toyonensis]|uniref:RICIN domain-containing protein n=1 Tax=Bacillus toyonensis TaxID=155322 RepID=UPI00346708F3
MKKSFNKIEKKAIPITATLGILFSLAPVAEYKPQAGAATVIDVSFNILGIVKDIFEATGIDIEEDHTYDTTYYAEHFSYAPPKFEPGAFYISMYHTKAQWGFSREIKIYYPDGKNEYYQIRPGQQLKITEAGTMVDLDPSSISVTNDDIIYITQQQLDEGNTGVGLNESNAVYVKSASGQNTRLISKIYKKHHGEDSLDGFKGLAQDLTADFTPEEKELVQLKSTSIGREAFTQYVTNNPQTQTDFNTRLVNVITDTNRSLQTHIINTSTHRTLYGGLSVQIIPIYPGGDKVLIKCGSQLLSGKNGQSVQYTNNLSEDNIFTLIKHNDMSPDGKVQFQLKSKDGAYLTTDELGIRLEKELNKETREWYFPVKTNEKLQEWMDSWSYLHSTSYRDAHFNENSIKNGTYHMVTGVNGTSVVDMNRMDKNASIYNLNGSSHQKWIFEFDDKQGAYQIKSSNDPNLVLTWNAIDGSDNVFTKSNEKKQEQYWLPEDAGQGYFYLKNKKDPNKVLDVQGGYTTNGTNLIVYNKQNNWGQSFKLKKIKDEYVSNTSYSEDNYEDEHNTTTFKLDAWYHIMAGVDNSKTLDIERHSGNARLWSRNTDHAQQWRFEYDSKEKAYQIKSADNLNWVLAWIDYQGSKNVARVTNEKKPEHYWILEDAGQGYFYIKNKKNPNLVLDVQGGYTANGTNLIVYNKQNSWGQSFKLLRKL